MKKVPKNIALNINLSPHSHPGTSVFTYRGTDIDKNIWEAMKDVESDLAIASSGNVFCIGWAEPIPRCLHLLHQDDQESWRWFR